jgi:hypothetical protein
MSRRPAGEVQFGSDSFLDVVCNIVGILIILIVIAGVRVSRAPLLAIARQAVANSGAGEPDAVSPFALVDEADDSAEPPLEPQFAVELPPDETPELERQLAALDGEQVALNRQLLQSLAELAKVKEREATLEEQIAAARAAFEQSQSELTATQQTVAATTAELAALRQQAAQLVAQIRAAQERQVATQEIQHRITPVGRTVTDGELHFRIEQNRVSVIPLEPLLKRLKEQIERRKEWLAKSREHRAQVGPVEGYTLQYLVQRDNMSVVDELRYGSGMYRISVAQWELELDRDVITETAERALTPGSKFYQAVLEADSEAALTFWVYPDSFETYGKLKAFCHAQNFLVAGRPLPAGTPIAGSPSGTRSSGQ